MLTIQSYFRYMGDLIDNPGNTLIVNINMSSLIKSVMLLGKIIGG